MSHFLAGPVNPGILARLAGTTRFVHQNAILGKRIQLAAIVVALGYLFGYRKKFALRLEAIGIHRLSHQRPFANKKQKAEPVLSRWRSKSGIGFIRTSRLSSGESSEARWIPLLGPRAAR